MRSLTYVRDRLMCPLCGMPLKVCRERSNEKKFAVDYERCFAVKAIHAEQRKLSPDSDGKGGIEDPESLSFSVSLSG